MTEKLTALRLADALSDRRDWYEFDPSAWCPQAAAELRRLHALNQELLEALKLAEKHCPVDSHAEILTRVAIAKAEGQA